MSVVKIIELIGESDSGWEDAVRHAVAEAAKTVRNIQNVYVKEQKGVVTDGKIVKYRAIVKVSFILEGDAS